MCCHEQTHAQRLWRSINSSLLGNFSFVSRVLFVEGDEGGMSMMGYKMVQFYERLGGYIGAVLRAHSLCRFGLISFTLPVICSEYHCQLRCHLDVAMSPRKCRASQSQDCMRAADIYVEMSSFCQSPHCSPTQFYYQRMRNALSHENHLATDVRASDFFNLNQILPLVLYFTFSRGQLSPKELFCCDALHL